MGSKALGLIGVCLLAVASAEAGPLDVDPWSGALVLERTDLSLGEGDAAFELRRTLQAEGWAWSCDSRLGQAEDGALCWIDEAGRAHAFVKAGEGWVARYGAPWTLAQTQAGYALVAGGRTYRFDGAGQLVERSTRGATLTYTPGPHGPTAVEGPWGTLTLERSPFGLTRAALEGAEVRYGYRDGKLVFVERGAQREAYAYGTDGRLQRADQTEVAHDAEGRVTRLVGGRVPLSASYPAGEGWVCEVREQGRSARYVRTGNTLDVLAETGAALRYRLDARLRPQVLERDGTFEASWSYDAQGRLTQHHTPAGDLKLSYGEGGPTSVELPTGETLRQVYDAAGRLLARTHALGTERFAYDGRGRLVAHLDARGLRSRFKHDARGYLVAVDEGGRVTQIKRSATGDVLAVRHPEGRVETFSERGAALKVVDSQGTVRASAFDASGRMIAYQDEFGRATRLAYNGYGQIARAYDHDGDLYRCSYDAEGRLIELTDAAGNSVSYARPDARTLVVEDPSAGRRELSFNDLGQVVREVRGAVTLGFRYDAAGRLIARTTPRGEECFAYDRAGRLISQAGPDGELRYAYDPAGRLRSSENRALHQRIDYRYEGASTQPSEVIYPWGAVRYRYDAAGGLVEVAAGEQTIRLERTPDGRRARVRYPSGVETRYAYDGKLLGEVSTWRGDALLSRRAYRYDERGRVSEVTDERGSTTRFSHDRRGRLLVAVGEEGRVGYRYDAAGNWTAVERGGEVEALEVGAGNRVLARAGTTYRYDARGALIGREGPDGTWRYEVDVDGRLRAAHGPEREVRYGYAPDGTPLWREVDGERERYLVDRQQVVGEFDAGGLVRSYVRGEGLDDVLLSEAGGERWAFHRDLVSSVTALTDGQGQVVARYRYDAFGAALSAEGPAAEANRWRYAGRPLDAETGLYDVRARRYDPALGRFTSPDPSGRASGLNLYAYAENDPTRLNDPLGLWSAMAAQWSDPDFEPRPFGAGVADAFRDGFSRMEYLSQRMGPDYAMKFQMAKGAGQAGLDAGQGVLDLFKKQTWVDLYEFVGELDDWETVKAVGAHVVDSGADAGSRYWDALNNDPLEASRMSGYGGATIFGMILGGKGLPQLTQVARASKVTRLADAVEDVADLAEDAGDLARTADRVEDVAEGGASTAGLARLLETGGDAAKPHGDFRRGLREGLAEPVSAAARRALAARWAAIEERAAALRKRPWRESPAMQSERMAGSGTVRGEHGALVGTDGAAIAARNFQAADDMVRVWARSGTPLTLDRIKKINELLGEGLEHNFMAPGVLRSEGFAAPGGVPIKMYVPGEEVADAMTDFMAWYGEAQASGMPPVELAAGAYQRMVSIHPFADANGRTSRMVMDYVLQQNGLPPATLADVNVAVFGGERALGIVDGASVTPEQALTKVTAGVERSLELLEALP